MLIAALPEKVRLEPYFPVALGRLTLYRPGLRLWTHAHVTQNSDGGDGSFTGRLRVLDSAGRLVAEIDDLRLKRADAEALLPSPAEDFQSWLYEVEWQAEPADVSERSGYMEARLDAGLGELAPAATSEIGMTESAAFSQRPAIEEEAGRDERQDSGHWIILADEEGVGEALAVLLRQRGETCRLIHARTSGSVEVKDQRIEPDMLRELSPALLSAGGRVRGVVHLWSLDTSRPTR